MKCIYVRTNLVNGKQYVGQANDFKQRECEWKCTKKHYAGKVIDNARAKYGVENFTVEILKECETQDELNKWEIYYIKELNTKKPNGYNMTDGGETSSGYNLTKEHIERIKEYGMYESTCRKPVLQYDLDGNFIKEWISASSCKREGGYNQGVVSACCRGERRRYKNYQWKYKDGDEIPQKIEPYDYELTHKNRSESQKGKILSLETKIKKSKPVLQYDLDGNFIREWYGANAAAKELGLRQYNIWAVLNNKAHTTGDFKFKYKN